MKRTLVYPCFAAALLILTACAPAPAPAPAPEPENTTEADIAAINGMVDQWLEAWNAADGVTLNSLYADDAVRMLPDSSNLTGREAILGRQQAGAEAYRERQQTVSKDDLRVSGDLAFLSGDWSAVRTPVGGEAESLNGKYIWLLERQDDGSWKIVRHIHNVAPAEG